MIDGTSTPPNVGSGSRQPPNPQYDAMTLRDYFAAKAMQSIFGGLGAEQVANRDERYNEENWAEIVASNSYQMADAMLKERES